MLKSSQSGLSVNTIYTITDCEREYHSESILTQAGYNNNNNPKTNEIPQ